MKVLENNNGIVIFADSINNIGEFQQKFMEMGFQNFFVETITIVCDGNSLSYENAIGMINTINLFAGEIPVITKAFGVVGGYNSLVLFSFPNIEISKTSTIKVKPFVIEFKGILSVSELKRVLTEIEYQNFIIAEILSNKCSSITKRSRYANPMLWKDELELTGEEGILLTASDCVKRNLIVQGQVK